MILTVFLRLPSKKGRRLSPPQNIRPYGLFGLTALVAVLNTVFTFIQHCSCTMNKSAPLALTGIKTQTFVCFCIFLIIVLAYLLDKYKLKDRFRPLSYLINCVFNFTVYRKINYMQTTSTCLTFIFVSVNNKKSFFLVF